MPKRSFLKAHWKSIAAFFVISCVLVGFAVAVVSDNLRITNRGRVITVGVNAYWDVECTEVVYYIEWGLIEPNSYVNRVIYLKSASNVPINLTQHINSWLPLNASSYISISWNYTGATLNPGEVIAVTETLFMAGDISGIDAFSFDMLIVSNN